jgi:lytic murein transglycosylase
MRRRSSFVFSSVVTLVVLGTAFAATGVATPALAIESCVASLKQQAISSGRPARSGSEDAVWREVRRESHPLFNGSARVQDRDLGLHGVPSRSAADPGRKANLKKHARTLDAVEKRYGVDKHIVFAVWGIESDYGNFRGDFYTPHALANLVCAGKRRQKYFRGELMKTLQIASSGDVRMDDFRGSWAGAFGQTQFMPTTFASLAVDFDGDGRKDLVNSVPDALASTANFLKNAGWRNSRLWGFEVKVPKGYSGPSGRKNYASTSTWTKRGLRNLDGSTLKSKADTALIRPAGANGPAFLVTRNFKALRSYNASTSYGLAIAVLSELVSGGDPIMTPWPTDNPGLSRAQRLELQKLLNRNGFNVGEPDGKVGPMTRKGIRAAEAKYGMPVTGRPSWNVYYALGGR